MRVGFSGKVRGDMVGRPEEAFVLWSAARAEANIAYDDWCASPGTDAYVVYRAAEDRADAAEADLANVTADQLIFA